MDAAIYDNGEYLTRNPGWHEGDAPHKARWIADFLITHECGPRHIVEIGSGSGEVLVQLSRLLPDTTMEGWDISPQAHAIAGGKSAEGLQFHHGAYKPADADLTMALDVFEHVDDYLGFLRDMKKAAGLKLFHIPLDLSAQGLLRGKGLLHTRRKNGHLHYFCKDTALATLEDCGFKVLGWRYTHGAEELPNRPLRTRLFNLPRKLMRAIDEDMAVRLMGGASMLVLAE